MENRCQSSDLIALPDGRNLFYAVYGDPDATATVFFHHGLPGSHVEALGLDAPARRNKLRLIAIDRPGFHRSDYQNGRRLVDWPADLLAVADHLQVARFAVMGVSGGVPYTLACLHAIPRARCVGAAAVAGIYPVRLGTDGMMLQNRLLLGIVPYTTWLISAAVEWMWGAAARDTAHPERFEKVFDKFMDAMPGPDRAAALADPEMRAILIEDMRLGTKPGSRGTAWELKIAAEDWGFALDDIKEVEGGKLVIWHGRRDVNAPVAMAEKAGALIPGAEARISEEDAHMSIIVNKKDEIMETMAKMLSE